MNVYYNENDSQKAAWLRELIKAQVIAHGDVDERSIKDVRPNDLQIYRQCHFFAGIGVWSYSLRLAGWPDERPVWTGSCPCSPFSSAGKGRGFNDSRHLWPDWARLIRECKPPVIFGEQADDAIGFGWLDLVQAELEAANYAVGKAVLGAASVGAPHIRQRLYFVADSSSNGENERRLFKRSSPVVELDNSNSFRLQGSTNEGDEAEEWEDEGRQARFPSRAVGGFWRGAEWIPCRSLKVPGAVEWRPIKPGTFPLAHGTPARVLRLRGYGDAINAQVAKAFIESCQEAISR